MIKYRQLQSTANKHYQETPKSNHPEELLCIHSDDFMLQKDNITLITLPWDSDIYMLSLVQDLTLYSITSIIVYNVLNFH